MKMTCKPLAGAVVVSLALAGNRCLLLAQSSAGAIPVGVGLSRALVG